MSSFTERGVKKYRVATDWKKLLSKYTENYQKWELRGSLNAAADSSFRERVHKKLCELGVGPDFMPPYFAYAEALFYMQFRLKYMVDRKREHQILRAKWEKRGLDPAILDELDKMLIFNLAIK